MVAAVQRQDAATEDVAAAVEELSTSLTESARGAHEKVFAAGKLSKQAAAEVESLAQETAGLARDAAQAASMVRELDARNRSVSGVVAVIRDISELPMGCLRPYRPPDRYNAPLRALHAGSWTPGGVA